MNFSLSRADLRRSIVWLSLWIALFAGASTPSLAGIIEPTGETFDHLATGFPLIGRHQLLSCETCHRDGVFKGIPKLCAGCHDNKTARGKHVNHIPTIENCAACHVPQGFNVAAVMDHSVTALACAACHNGLLASGKSASHLQTSNNCAGCHRTSAWVPLTGFDHSETDKPCFTCHNGKIATGKSSRHILSTNLCGSCHRTSGSFNSAFTVDHKEVLGSCGSNGCHDGVSHTGKSPLHAPTTNECRACHLSTAGISWGPVAKVDHKQVLPGSCVVCHSLNQSSSQVQGLAATPQPADHVPTTASCDLCHDVTVWVPAKRVHSVLTIVDKCVTCHVTGIRATAKPATHIPTGNVCEICHTATTRISLADWKKPNITSDFAALHTQTLGACAFCHDGIKATGKNKISNHVVTSEDCSVCHKSTLTFKGAAVDHTGFVKNCTTCHGVTASGKSGKHLKGLNTTNDCDSCHKVFPASWAPAFTFDHSLISPPTACAVCHDGSGTLAKKGKDPVKHIPTTLACESCHSSTTAWTAVTDHAGFTANCVSCHTATSPGQFQGARGKEGKHLLGLTTTNVCESCHKPKPAAWTLVTFDHALIQPPTACVTCHDGSGKLAKNGKSSGHPTTTTLCESCHVNTVWKPVTKIDHVQATGPCAQCHGVFATATGKSAIHFPTTQPCETCHTSTAVWTGAKVNHSTLTATCVSCHNGTFIGTKAAGKGGKHTLGLNTNDACEKCHNVSPAGWVPAKTFDHTQIQPATACAICHDGSGRLAKKGKGPTHIVTSLPCESCHNTNAWSPAGVDHSVIFNNCISCHNGTQASGKGGKHLIGLNTSNLCETCHNKLPLRWLPARTFDHTQIQPATACAICHDGTGRLAVKGKGPTHIVTSLPCDSCHNTNAWSPAGVDHSIITNNCIRCHDGVQASGKSGKHTLGLNTSNLCENCHEKFPLKWLPARTFDHTQIQPATACAICHDGSGRLAKKGKPANHVPTTAACNICHLSVVDWSLVDTNHSTFVNLCVSCHTGAPGIYLGARGKVGKHTLGMQTSDTCEACHAKKPLLWTPILTFNHNQTTASCVSCHNASFPSFRYKTSGHMLTSDNCVACHTTAGWTPATTNHAEVLLPIATCVSCHNGTTSGSTTDSGHCSITGFDCDDCHSATNFNTWNSVVNDQCGNTPPPPTPVPIANVNLTANPTSVTSGGTSNLIWSSTGATACAASGSWSGPKALSGNEVRANLTATSTFTLTCSGVSRSVTVAVTPPAGGGGVTPPTVSLSANPTNVISGGSTTLTWNSTGATACNASDSWSGVKAVVGSESIPNLTTTSTFTLICTGAGGSANWSVVVSVAAPTPQPTPVPTPTPAPVATPPPMGGGGGGMGGGMAGGGGGGGGGGGMGGGM